MVSLNARETQERQDKKSPAQRKRDQREREKLKIDGATDEERERLIKEKQSKRQKENAKSYKKRRQAKEAVEEAAAMERAEAEPPGRKKHDRNYEIRFKESGKEKPNSRRTTTWADRPKAQRDQHIAKLREKYLRKVALGKELKIQELIRLLRTSDMAASVPSDEKRRFLIDKLKWDEDVVKDLSELRLTLKFSEMQTRYSELKQKGLSQFEIVAACAAEDIAAAGKIAEGSGFIGMENLVSMAARICVFSKEKIVRQCIETTAKYANADQFSKCQENLERGDEGIMNKKSTFVQAGQDAKAGKFPS